MSWRQHDASANTKKKSRKKDAKSRKRGKRHKKKKGWDDSFFLTKNGPNVKGRIMSPTLKSIGSLIVK